MNSSDLSNVYYVNDSHEFHRTMVIEKHGAREPFIIDKIRTTLIGYFFVLITLSVMGMAGNLVLVYVLMCRWCTRSTFTYYTSIMSGCQALKCCVMVPVVMTMTWSSLLRSTVASSLCMVYRTGLVFFTINTSLLLVLTSLDRFSQIARPWRIKKPRRAFMKSGAVFIFSAVYAMPVVTLYEYTDIEWPLMSKIQKVSHDRFDQPGFRRHLYRCCLRPGYEKSSSVKLYMATFATLYIVSALAVITIYITVCCKTSYVHQSTKVPIRFPPRQGDINIIVSPSSDERSSSISSNSQMKMDSHTRFKSHEESHLFPIDVDSRRKPTLKTTSLKSLSISLSSLDQGTRIIDASAFSFDVMKGDDKEAAEGNDSFLTTRMASATPTETLPSSMPSEILSSVDGSDEQHYFSAVMRRAWNMHRNTFMIETPIFSPSDTPNQPSPISYTPTTLSTHITFDPSPTQSIAPYSSELLKSTTDRQTATKSSTFDSQIVSQFTPWDPSAPAKSTSFDPHVSNKSTALDSTAPFKASARESVVLPRSTVDPIPHRKNTEQSLPRFQNLFRYIFHSYSRPDKQEIWTGNARQVNQRDSVIIPFASISPLDNSIATSLTQKMDNTSSGVPKHGKISNRPELKDHTWNFDNKSNNTKDGLLTGSAFTSIIENVTKEQTTKTEAQSRVSGGSLSKTLCQADDIPQETINVTVRSPSSELMRKQSAFVQEDEGVLQGHNVLTLTLSNIATSSTSILDAGSILKKIDRRPNSFSVKNVISSSEKLSVEGNIHDPKQTIPAVNTIADRPKEESAESVTCKTAVEKNSWKKMLQVQKLHCTKKKGRKPSGIKLKRNKKDTPQSVKITEDPSVRPVPTKKTKPQDSLQGASHDTSQIDEWKQHLLQRQQKNQLELDIFSVAGSSGGLKVPSVVFSNTNNQASSKRSSEKAVSTRHHLTRSYHQESRGIMPYPRTVIVFLFIVLSFLITYTLVVLLAVSEVFGFTHVDVDLKYLKLMEIFFFVHDVANPFIWGLLNFSFRREITELIGFNRFQQVPFKVSQQHILHPSLRV